MPIDPIDTTQAAARNGLRNACTILQSGRSSCSSFLQVFDQLRDGRRGTPTDGQQDLLRAMLLFGSSCLDAVVKQLIQDSLGNVIENNPGAHQQFETYIDRKLKKSKGSSELSDELVVINFKYLSSILASREPRKLIIDDLISSLVGDSLQSRDQLLKTAAYFAITRDEIMADVQLVGNIFSVRNEITHEMDIDLTQPNRNRRPRRREDMTRYTNELLQIGCRFIEAVSGKIP